MTDEQTSGLGRVEYDPATREYYASHADDAPASTVVPTAVAEITDRRVEELPPLQRVVDPDALDDLLEVGSGPDYAAEIEISFTYAGVDVTVNSSGVVVLEPVEDEE